MTMSHELEWYTAGSKYTWAMTLSDPVELTELGVALTWADRLGTESQLAANNVVGYWGLVQDRLEDWEAGV